MSAETAKSTAAMKAEREKMVAKLTSQTCIRKTPKESCTPSSKNTSGASSLDMRYADSAEVLQTMRRDSGAGDGSTDGIIVKYSKGESIVEDTPKEEEQILKIRPELAAKFRPGVINQIIEATIREHLSDKEYSAEEAQGWTKAITEAILQKTKEHNFARYKIVACVVIGESRGQGISSAYRCLWDAEADCAASYTFMNDTLYCVGMVFGVYFY